VSRRAAIPRAPEREVLSGVLALLTARGIPHWRAHAGGGWRLGRHGRPQLIRAGPEGLPDVVGWLPAGFGGAYPGGTMLAIEAKRPGERPRPEQVATMRRMLADGCCAFWVDDVSMCDMILNAIRNGRRVEMDEDGDQWLAGPEEGSNA
jgi:hypothetical protein